MAMDRKAFDALVACYEAIETASPSGFRARVRAFAPLGYARITFVLMPLHKPCNCL